MLNEISKNYYCSADSYKNLFCRKGEFSGMTCFGVLCSNYRRKHPTPEQFREEYGEEWEGAVYIKCGISNCTENCNNKWILYPSEPDAIADMCATGLEEADPIIVCACTPFGKPDDDCRPE